MSKTKFDLGSKLGATLSQIKDLKDDMTSSSLAKSTSVPGILPNEKKLTGQLQIIPLTAIIANPDQPRKVFKSAEIQSLAESIRVHGLIQPIVVRERQSDSGKKEYIIIAGERRYRATVSLKHNTIQAIVVDWKHAMQMAGEGYSEHGNDRKLLELALLENLQRENLNAVEQGNAYQSMQSELGYSISDIAERLKISDSLVKNRLRLVNKLDEFLKLALISDSIQILLTQPAAKAIVDTKSLNTIFLILAEQDFFSKLSDADIANGFTSTNKEDKQTPAYRSFLKSNSFLTILQEAKSTLHQSELSIDDVALAISQILTPLCQSDIIDAFCEESVQKAYPTRIPESILTIRKQLKSAGLIIDKIEETAFQTLFSEGHARCLLNLDRASGQQRLVFDLIIQSAWSVRQTESYVKKIKETTTQSDSPAQVQNQPQITEFETAEWKQVKTDCKRFFESNSIDFKKSGTKVKLTVTFDTADAMDTFISKIQS